MPKLPYTSALTKMRHGARLVKVSGRTLVRYHLTSGDNVADDTAAKLIEHRKSTASMTACCPTANSHGAGSAIPPQSNSLCTASACVAPIAPPQSATAVCTALPVRRIAAS